MLLVCVFTAISFCQDSTSSPIDTNLALTKSPCEDSVFVRLSAKDRLTQADWIQYRHLTRLCSDYRNSIENSDVFYAIRYHGKYHETLGWIGVTLATAGILGTLGNCFWGSPTEYLWSGTHTSIVLSCSISYGFSAWQIVTGRKLRKLRGQLVSPTVAPN
jgi:hypothetical protein